MLKRAYILTAITIATVAMSAALSRTTVPTSESCLLRSTPDKFKPDKSMAVGTDMLLLSVSLPVDEGFVCGIGRARVARVLGE